MPDMKRLELAQREANLMAAIEAKLKKRNIVFSAWP